MSTLPADDKNNISVSDILEKVFRREGIESKNKPEIHINSTKNGVCNRIKIQTLEALMENLEKDIDLQISIHEPTISNIEKNPFRMKFLSIVTTHEGNLEFTVPAVETEEEEISKEQEKKIANLCSERTNEIGKTVLKALKMVLKITELVHDTVKRLNP